jgi:hypothetical protein
MGNQVAYLVNPLISRYLTLPTHTLQEQVQEKRRQYRRRNRLGRSASAAPLCPVAEGTL